MDRDPQGSDVITLVAAICGLTMLYIGAESLIRGASSLATLTGTSRTAIGLTVVAFGTSTPELVVSVGAALSGASDISLGNIVGSNIANLSLILGLAALCHPLTVHAKIVRVDAPLMVLASLALVAVMADGQASRTEGALLLFGLLAYTSYTFLEARTESREVRQEFAAAVSENPPRPLISVALVFVGLGLLIGGGHLLVIAAVTLTTVLGVSEAVVGLTIVAIGTSLPEAAASVVAALRGHGDIAIANVLGSNIFNVLGILGVTSTLRPLELGAITWIDMGAMVAVSGTLAILLLMRPGLGRAAGSVLFAFFFLYAAWVFAA